MSHDKATVIRWPVWHNRVMPLSLIGPERRCCHVSREVMEGQCVCVCLSTFLLTSNFCIFSPWPSSHLCHSPFLPLTVVEEEVTRYRHGNHPDDSGGLHLQECLSVQMCVCDTEWENYITFLLRVNGKDTRACLYWDFFSFLLLQPNCLFSNCFCQWLISLNYTSKCILPLKVST